MTPLTWRRSALLITPAGRLKPTCRAMRSSASLLLKFRATRSQALSSAFDIAHLVVACRAWRAPRRRRSRRRGRRACRPGRAPSPARRSTRGPARSRRSRPACLPRALATLADEIAIAVVDHAVEDRFDLRRQRPADVERAGERRGADAVGVHADLGQRVRHGQDQAEDADRAGDRGRLGADLDRRPSRSSSRRSRRRRPSRRPPACRPRASARLRGGSARTQYASPPGELTRSTTALTRSSSRAARTSCAVDSPPIVPGGCSPATISPSATTTATCGARAPAIAAAERREVVV